MVKIDEVKEYIGFLKAIFITLIIVDTSLIAWVFKNYNIEFFYIFYSAIFFIFSIIGVVYGLAIDILEKIKSLKDM